MSESGKTRDVRMRGFAQRSTVEAAWQWVDDNAAPLPGKSVELSAAAGRVLAEDVTAPTSVPAFERSAMDGYAVIAAETTGATDYAPLTFEVIGASLPARPFDGTVGPGQAIRIMTGAPFPAGATAVIPVEYTQQLEDQVAVSQPIPEGRHVGRIGEDIGEGTTVLPTGRLLRPQDIGVIASLGYDKVPVVRRPRVRLITTGNELAVAGQPRGPFQIYDANTPMLSALVSRDGGVLESAVRVEDSAAAIHDAITHGDVDVVLVGGGSSVGEEDYAPQVLRRAGELPIHGVAMRPSSPSGLGRIGATLVFLLPGNPVSSLCAFDFFAGRAIRLMGGRALGWPYQSRTARLTRKIASVVGRVDYCRVKGSGDECEPIAISGASVLSSTTRADGFVIVPAGSEGYADGASVTVFDYGPTA